MPAAILCLAACCHFHGQPSAAFLGELFQLCALLFLCACWRSEVISPLLVGVHFHSWERDCAFQWCLGASQWLLICQQQNICVALLVAGGFCWAKGGDRSSSPSVRDSPGQPSHLLSSEAEALGDLLLQNAQPCLHKHPGFAGV